MSDITHPTTVMDEFKGYSQHLASMHAQVLSSDSPNVLKHREQIVSVIDAWQNDFRSINTDDIVLASINNLTTRYLNIEAFVMRVLGDHGMTVIENTLPPGDPFFLS